MAIRQTLKSKFYSLENHRKSIFGNAISNGIPHSISAGGQLGKLKNHHPPAVSVVTFSADVATLYREQKDPEKMENLEEELSGDLDENSGFAIIINGHSLIHCLTPELETRFVGILVRIHTFLMCNS